MIHYRDLRAKGSDRVPGSVIFKLYDTYGFPVDIVRDVVRDEKMVLDMDGFESSMQAQRERSRSVATFSETRAMPIGNCPPKGIKSEFLGYAQDSLDTTILVLVCDGKEVAQHRNGHGYRARNRKNPILW